MKKNYIIILLFLLSISTVIGQVTLIDQQSNLNDGIISSILADVSLGTYSGDDFTLTDTYSIDVVTVNGFGSAGSDISANFTGLDLFIYDDAAGVPDSDPTSLGTGLLELINIPPTSPAIVYDGTDDSFTIDISMANGGTDLVLDAGTYWLVVAARVPSNAVRWNWFASAPGGNAVLFDEGNFGGLPWTDLPSLGLTFDSLAMKIEGTLNPLSVDEFALNTLTIFPIPAKDMITIDVPGSVGDFKTEIYSILGQLVAKSSNKKQINVSNLNSGVYLIRIYTDNGSITKRFTKE